jgi:hypothetical protein
MCKKRGRHDKDAKSTNNDEEQYVTQFFNFMRKHSNIIISLVSVPQINLDVGTGFTLSCAGSVPDNQKYHVHNINEPTPCKLVYVKNRILRSIKVADAFVMASHIMHGCPVPS